VLATITSPFYGQFALEIYANLASLVTLRFKRPEHFTAWQVSKVKCSSALGARFQNATQKIRNKYHPGCRPYLLKREKAIPDAVR
jgi:hypothetical protein